MQINVNAFVILVLLIMLAVAVPYFFKSYIYNGVYKEIQKKNFDKAIYKLNQKIYTILFGKYDRDLMLLRIYITTQDYKNCEAHIMEMMTNSNLNSTQSYQAANMAYYFFIDAENKEMCKFLLPFMNKRKYQKQYDFACCLYRVIIEKKSEDIEENKKLLESLKEEKEENKQNIGLLQYLIGLQYMYMKKNTEAKEYLNKARINLKGSPYHRKINSILK